MKPGAVLQIQYFAAGVSRRAQAASAAIARRHDRSARQAASSARSRPRPRAPCRRAPRASSAGRRASSGTRCDGARDAAPARAPCASCPADAIAQSSRVSCTISMMVRTPRAFLADAPREGAVRTRPRTMHSSGCRACPSGAGNAAPLTEPSGRKRGIRKQVSPPGACASTRKASHIGADMNHLWPVMRVAVAGRRRASWCWRARRCRPASRSCPCRA